jgi:hypothetical protein
VKFEKFPRDHKQGTIYHLVLIITNYSLEVETCLHAKPSLISTTNDLRTVLEEKKDAEKRSRYAPVLEIFNCLHEREGLTMIQFNFMVGVRGSISNVHRTEPLSFTSTLKALGITSRINLDRIRKVVANRTFKTLDLMLRSYYAVKFSSSSQVDFSRLVGTLVCPSALYSASFIIC